MHRLRRRLSFGGFGCHNSVIVAASRFRSWPPLVFWLSDVCQLCNCWAGVIVALRFIRMTTVDSYAVRYLFTYGKVPTVFRFSAEWRDLSFLILLPGATQGEHKMQSRIVWLQFRIVAKTSDTVVHSEAVCVRSVWRGWMFVFLL